MSYTADTVVFAKPTGALDPSHRVPGVATYLAPDPEEPVHYINVRLTNGTGYYNAGGTTVSGGSALSADQGAPSLLSSAWPVKVTDGTSVFGAPTYPFYVTLSSGSLGNQPNPLWITGSVLVLNPSTGGGGTTTVTGSVSLSQGVAVSNVVSVTGTVALARAVDVASLPSVTVGNVVTVTGSVGLSMGPNVVVLSGSVSGLLVGGQPASQANPVPVSQQGTVSVTGSVVASQLPRPLIDATNSTTTPLSASANFSGSAVDVSGYASTTVAWITDQAGTLYPQFSSDGTHWDYSEAYPVVSGTGDHIQIGPQAQFFRVFLANGNGAQTVLRLQTIHRVVTPYAPVVSVSSQIDPNGDAIVTKSSITGKTTAGGTSYVDVKVSPAGAVQVGGTLSVLSGSVTALNVGGVEVSQENPLPVSTWEPLVQQRYDIQTTVAYSGYAARGTSTGSAVWTIKRTGFDGSGNPTDVTWATGSRWSDRLTEVYS